MENKQLKIELNPDRGCKIVSFYEKKKQFELFPRSTGANGLYGFDDCFPNIIEEKPYPDHGEIWNGQFKKVREKPLTFEFKSHLFHYTYTKSFRLVRNHLFIDYRIEYEGEVDFPCIFTCHPLFRGDVNLVILYPPSASQIVTVMDSDKLGKEGKVSDLNTPEFDLYGMGSEEDKNCEKFYLIDPVKEGECGIRYLKQGVECRMNYDQKELPYFGVWINANGYQNQYNLALEPSSSFYDGISIATKNNTVKIMKQGEVWKFTIDLSLHSLKKS